MPQAAKGRFAVVIPRPEHLQIAYIGRKGADPQLRADGIESFRRNIVELIPWVADRIDELRSMDDVKYLDVRLNRLSRWHVDGLLCIGDAAHAMSPVGGVGINLAVQDAVAAATLLAEPLLTGSLSPATLGRVRTRRLLPTILVQSMQRIMHRAVVAPIVAMTRGAVLQIQRTAALPSRVRREPAGPRASGQHERPDDHLRDRPAVGAPTGDLRTRLSSRAGGRRHYAQGGQMGRGKHQKSDD